MNSILGKNWKTTTAGLAAILGAVADLLVQLSSKSGWDMTRLQVDFAAVTGGIGLIFAKDSNVTGGDVKQK